MWEADGRSCVCRRVGSRFLEGDERVRNPWCVRRKTRFRWDRINGGGSSSDWLERLSRIRAFGVRGQSKVSEEGAAKKKAQKTGWSCGSPPIEDEATKKMKSVRASSSIEAEKNQSGF